jgi:HrpA-like RNA helicase
MLVGNDYTSFVQEKKLRKSVNFFRDHCADGNKRLKLADVFDQVSELDGFHVESTDPNQQLNIEFSRALFRLENISPFLEERDDNDDDDLAFNGEEEEKKEDAEEIIDDTDMNNYVKAFDQSLVPASGGFGGKDFCLKSHIMSPFENVLHEGEDIVPFLEETYDVMRAQSLSYVCVPSKLKWRHVQLSTLFQRSIRATLNIVPKGILGYEGSPSMIFDHLCFFHALVARMVEEVDPETNDLAPNKKERSSHHTRLALPIDAHKDAILKSVKENRVTIIQGETGSGKSSRVPVMLLEAPPPEPTSNKVKMFICQQRRIAAKSLTERIRMTEPHLKDLIGLRMGHGVREYESKRTQAWFVTTGYLVRYLANNQGAFHDVDYLIIDEVHERSIDSDILCLLAKRLLETHPKIRIVLMSATVAADMYQKYFDVSEPPIFVGVRCFPINEYFVEDIGKHLRLSSKECKALDEIKDKCNKSRCQLAPNSHHILKLHHLAAQIAVEVGKGGTSVLIFVSGMADIVSITEIFEGMVGSIKYKCVPIHSDIPFEDQMEAFDSPKQNEVKIIIATNAAESSITLPDVDNVICFGLCKAITYNKQSHRQMLETTWISKANATQRAGRTGRVREGSVYRLYPRKAFNDYFRKFEEGEILRSPLDSVILNLRTIVADESITEILRGCIEPPDTVNIENSFNSLFNRKFTTAANDNFEITSLGDLVVALGIDLTIGALVGFGARLGSLRETIEVAAILSFPKSPWLLPNALLQEPEVYNGENYFF